jgi:molybdopterin synthase catalytic subunit
MIRIQEGPIDLNSLFDNITPDKGALVIFAGVVRNDGMDLLMYESDTEMAEKELNLIIEEAGREWGDLNVNVVHRYGKLKIGEVIVTISVAAGHRDAAFKAARYIIDELKVRVPIWKADVTNEKISWVNGEKE